MGAKGAATVLAIEPCPPIQPGEGNVLTGRFRHESSGKNVVDLRIVGQTAPTGVTTNHPYWSVDRQAFVPAGELKPGERLEALAGETRVESQTPLACTGLLYNRQVHGEHVYQVGSLGTLVHNQYVNRINASDLPSAEAAAVRRTMRHIDAGTTPSGPFAKKWGTKCENREGRLPRDVEYHKHRVEPSKGINGAGARRIVVGDNGAVYYTRNHYGDSPGHALDPAFVQFR